MGLANLELGIKNIIPNSLGKEYSNNFNRYTNVVTPNGGKIHIVAQSNLTDEQIIAIENIKFSKGSELELISWEPNKIIFKSISDSPQVIFLSEIYYPGWVVNDNNIINIKLISFRYIYMQINKSIVFINFFIYRYINFSNL